MVTLISAGNSEGTYGRCDAKCYQAHGGECDCICGGMNHGGGLQKAMSNTAELAESWIEKAQQKDPGLHDIYIPAIYSAKTPTAIKIASELNNAAGFNRVKDVRRVGRHWEVDLRTAKGSIEFETASYATLRTLRESLGVKTPAPVVSIPGPAQLSLF